MEKECSLHCLTSEKWKVDIQKDGLKVERDRAETCC